MPTPDDVIAALEPLIGIGEDPDGSNNVPPITEWYGMQDAWCAMTVSWAAAQGGFTTDGGATLDMPGIPKTTARGWAYVPYMAEDFASAGRYDGTPQRGDFGIVAGQVHVFLVEAVEDAEVRTIEGNYGNRLVRNRRTISSCEGFCHVPYDGSPFNGNGNGNGNAHAMSIPAFPGFVKAGATGPATRLVQQRLADLGFAIDVDGDFGPQTDAVVKQFQADRGLDADGVVGPITWARLFSGATG